MSLSPEEVQVARQKYLKGPSQGSGMGSNQPVDHAARMTRLSALVSPTKAASPAAPSGDGGSFLGDVGNAIGNVGKGLSESFQMAPTDSRPIQNIGDVGNLLKQTGEAGLHATGAIGKGVTDVIGSAINRSGAVKNVIKAAESNPLTGPTVKNLQTAFKSPVLQEGLGHLASGATDKYDSWKEKHPELSRTVEDAWNTATLVPVAEGGIAAAKALPALAEEGATAMGKGLATATEKAPQLIKGATEKAAGAMSAVKGAGKQNLAEYVMPKLSKSEAGNLASLGEGATAEKGLPGFKRTVAVPQAEHQEMATAVKGVVDPKKPLATNISKLNSSIKTDADELKTALSEQKGSWNKNTVKGKLNAIKTDIPAGLVGDNEKIYQRVIDGAMKEIEKAPSRKWGDLWEARKNIDKMVKDQFGDVAFESSKARDTAIRKVRQAINDHIDENTTGVEFKAKMKKFSNKYKVLENLEDKRADEIMAETKKTGSQKWAEKHPIVTKYGPGVAATLIGGSAVGTARKLIP
jgi:hypothetical protein